MALIDDPKAWILLMFQKEEREGRGEHCEIFPYGSVPDAVNCEDGELVYGAYKGKYFFSPSAFHVVDCGASTRIPWREVHRCSTRHGDGNRMSTLLLRNGASHKVCMSDLATGWNGRISQLFHQMIERYAHHPVLGPDLVTIDEFFAVAVDAYSLFPNVEPHPTLEELRQTLEELSNLEGVSALRIEVADDDIPIGIGLAILTSLHASDLTEWARALGSDGIGDASDNMRNHFGAIPEGKRVLHAIWD